MSVTKKEMHSFVRKVLKENDEWATKALIFLYNCQTDEEKKHGEDFVKNNVGFTRNDAKFLTAFAQVVENGHRLTSDQIGFVKVAVSKYSRQLIEISNKEKLKKMVETEDEGIFGQALNLV